MDGPENREASPVRAPLTVVERVHGAWVFGRRVRRLAEHVSRLLPEDAEVLDVGCGDGSIARLILEMRPDVRIRGVDTLVRRETQVPVEPYDGSVLPVPDLGVDVVTLIDVLHHTEDPTILLREAARVARRGVVVKDHLADGFGAIPTLRFMDAVGNARHGVALPYNYWSRTRWLGAFQDLGLRVTSWEQDLGLYPWPASLLFGRMLHFVAYVAESRQEATAERE